MHPKDKDVLAKAFILLLCLGLLWALTWWLFDHTPDAALTVGLGYVNLDLIVFVVVVVVGFAILSVISEPLPRSVRIFLAAAGPLVALWLYAHRLSADLR